MFDKFCFSKQVAAWMFFMKTWWRTTPFSRSRDTTFVRELTDGLTSFFVNVTTLGIALWCTIWCPLVLFACNRSYVLLGQVNVVYCEIRVPFFIDDDQREERNQARNREGISPYDLLNRPDNIKKSRYWWWHKSAEVGSHYWNPGTLIEFRRLKIEQSR